MDGQHDTKAMIAQVTSGAEARVGQPRFSTEALVSLGPSRRIMESGA